MKEILKSKLKKLETAMKDYTAGLPEPKEIALQDLSLALELTRYMDEMADGYHDRGLVTPAELNNSLDYFLSLPTEVAIKELSDIQYCHNNTPLTYAEREGYDEPKQRDSRNNIVTTRERFYKEFHKEEFYNEKK